MLEEDREGIIGWEKVQKDRFQEVEAVMRFILSD